MKKLDIGLLILTTLLVACFILIFYFGIAYLQTAYELMKYEPLTTIDQIIIFCVCGVMALFMFRAFYLISKRINERY
jgi:divalent metal cation (Fe/Co/Zn/Cd) transporter